MRCSVQLYALVAFCALAVSGCASSGVGVEDSKKADGTNVPSASVFAPTYKLRSGVMAYSRAREIYESSAPPSQGVNQRFGLVFVVVCIDTKSETLRYLEGTAMLRAKALLRQAFPKLPAEFFAQNRQLEKGLDDDSGIYRYAVVFREQDIVKMCEE